MRISDWSSDVCSSDLTAVPDTQRTWLRFADGHFSGCNMFYLATPAAAGVVQFWRSLEADRKHPLKMLRKIGPGSALCYLFGRLSLRNAVKHIGKRSGADAGIVELPFGRAAVDVDKPRSDEHTSEIQSLMR